MRNIELTDEELLALDGKVNVEAQKVIDNLKIVNTFSDVGDMVLAEILEKAVKIGKLDYHYQSDTGSCVKCKNSSSYAKFKSGPRKGNWNYDKPINLYFLKFFNSYKFQFCSDCATDILKTLNDYILNNDLKIQIKIDITKYLKEEKEICYSCKKDIWQFDKTLRNTLMGNGYYYSGCPHCGKEQFILGESHERTDEFRMININEVKKDRNCWQRK